MAFDAAAPFPLISLSPEAEALCARDMASDAQCVDLWDEADDDAADDRLRGYLCAHIEEGL